MSEEHRLGAVMAEIDLEIYSIEAVLKSAYRFTGRCYISIERPTPLRAQVFIRPKRAEDTSDDLLGDFRNDLIDQRLREIVGVETQGIRDLIMGHALSKTDFAAEVHCDGDNKDMDSGR